MGQKVSPIGMRIGVIRDWESRWYAGKKEFGDQLQEDILIRKTIFTDFPKSQISRIEIERYTKRVNIVVRTARPGDFFGQDGAAIEKLNKKLVKLTNGKEVNINVVEIANPDLDARIVALRICDSLENRQSFRTAQKKAIQTVMRAGAKGIKTSVSGRLGGADIARTEGYSEGVVPLHTLRSDIDFAWEEAMTTYGKLGVKVWICRGEVLPGEMVQEPEKPKNSQNGRGPRKGNKKFFKKEEAVAEAPKEEVKAEAAAEAKEDE